MVWLFILRSVCDCDAKIVTHYWDEVYFQKEKRTQLNKHDDYDDIYTR